MIPSTRSPKLPFRLSCFITQIRKATSGITKIAQNIRDAGVMIDSISKC